MNVELLEYPGEREWMEVKRRALVTIGKHPVNPPDMEWKRRILMARHSPIRYLRFSVLFEGIPYWLSGHLTRHVHAQPYVKSQRNDRQDEYDRNKAPQDAPVDMIWDLNGESLLIVANKRLCSTAAPETRQAVQRMCDLIEDACPEFRGLLVPMCGYTGRCYEMYPCARGPIGERGNGDRIIKPDICPACHWPIDKCQCRYTGSGHPDRDVAGPIRRALKHPDMYSLAVIDHVWSLASDLGITLED